MKKFSSKSGFTLVELMVVAVIVAILAGVAVPLMSANKKRAMATEAQAALGTVRSALRALYAETGKYTEDLNGGAISSGSVTNVPGVGAGDLNGRYFSEDCYTITAVTDDTYNLQADGDLSDSAVSPKAEDVAGILVTLDEEGTFGVTGL